MKIIYLAAYKAYHPNWNMTYQDINGKRDIGGDMLDVDLSPFDVIIATPPCNYYSKANYRKCSVYSQKTKHLLPSIIAKLSDQKKPFIVENVRSSLIDEIIEKCPYNIFIYQWGRHTYFTNIMFNPQNIKQIKDFSSNAKRVHGGYILNDGTFSKTNRVSRVNKNTQGGDNVHNVIEYWLKVVQSVYENK